jgi:hypothetical protein
MPATKASNGAHHDDNPLSTMSATIRAASLGRTAAEVAACAGGRQSVVVLRERIHKLAARGTRSDPVAIIAPPPEEARREA